MNKGNGRIKRAAAVWLALQMICCVLPASANSWGLRGELLDKVSAVNTWNDYGAIGKQAGNAAVMGSRYHNALMLVESGELKVYTTAVYQPGSPLADAVRLERQGDALILAYGKSRTAERYVFSPCEYGFCLTGATIGDFHMELVNEDGWQRFRVFDAQSESYLRWIPYMDQFNIELFPHSVEEVRHLNEMLAALDSGAVVLSGEGVRHSGVGSGTAPVYAAPFGESAWRAGKGKAAVGLKGEFWVLGAYVCDDGESYTCIRYDVSQRTQRIGYVRSAHIGEAPGGSLQDQMIKVDVIARRDTYLTDDPDVSQYPQLRVPEGTQLTCMAIYDGEYAYVGGEERNGKFVDGGGIVWGFVPLADLDIDPNSNHARDIQPDAMARLEGAWEFYAGGSMAQEQLIFHPDGTYQGINPREDGCTMYTGTYTVTAYNPDCNLYWNDPAYELILRDDDGSVNVRGLSFLLEDGEEIFSLTNWEGSGGYRRMQEREEF